MKPNLCYRYRSAVKRAEGSDRFVDGASQTINRLRKAKEAQCATTSQTTSECQAWQCSWAWNTCLTYLDCFSVHSWSFVQPADYDLTHD